MTYSYTVSYGKDVRIAPALEQLLYEISIHPEYKHLTNLGEIGDARHKGQGFDSDHNPFVVHNGVGIIRAADFGGPYELLMQLRAELFKVYRRKDPRIWPYGYLKGPDSNITDWPPGTGWHRNTGDEGHLHVSLNQRNGWAPSRNGWVPALGSSVGWGLSVPVIPADTTPDLLEEIMKLNPNSPEYKRLVADIAKATMATRYGKSGNAWDVITQTRGEVREQSSLLAKVAAKLGVKG